MHAAALSAGVDLRAFFYANFVGPHLGASVLPPISISVSTYSGENQRSRAFLSTLAVTFLAVLPVAYVAFLAITETIHAYQAAMTWLQNGGLKQLPATVSALPFIGNISQELLGRFVLAYGDLQGSLLEGGKAVSAVLLTGVSGLAKNTFDLITDFLIMLFTLFFFFRDGQRLYDVFYDAVPIDEGHKAVIFDRLTQTMDGVVRGTLLTALAQGVVAGLAYWALDVPFPVFLGAISALVSLLPFGGTALVWVPVAAVPLVDCIAVENDRDDRRGRRTRGVDGQCPAAAAGRFRGGLAGALSLLCLRGRPCLLWIYRLVPGSDSAGNRHRHLQDLSRELSGPD